jgi:phenylpropionate dioxygenase-like ring-hydroxylating dioxygenase large terminal subunit
MLTRELNDTLTRTGPGTPMGDLFRRFWIPALLAREVPERDGPPVRVKLLGEELIAFRDSNNRVGLVEARCPHRGANLFFGRNEECGIRCAYHGWKFDVDGNCLDIPTMPRDNSAYESLRSRVRIASYPTREWGEYVWAYLGPPEAMPKLPEMEFATVPPAHRFVTKKLQECNWAQAAEGGIDTAHFSFLHAPVGRDEAAIGTMTRGYSPRTMGQDQIRWMVNDGAPRYTAEKHVAGLVLAGARHADDGDLYWRIAQYLLPCHSLTPGTAKGEAYHGQTWVPIDDESCWIYTYTWNPERPLSDQERAAYAGGASIHAEVDANYVPIRRRSNDYLIDREMQKRVNYSGIKGISEQDQAIQDSQGRIHDRTREYLGPTDLGVVQFRLLMLAAARDLAAGQPPLAAHLPDACRVRSGAIVAPSGLPFAEVMLRRFGHAQGRFDLAGARVAEPAAE